MYKIGFIGMGNMGYAILKGLLKTFDSSEIIFTDANVDRMKSVSKETGVQYVDSNAECANKVKYVVLAVKPQFYDKVLKNIENVITEDKVVISIAPGKTIEYIDNYFKGDTRVVRAMPNTPALIGEGMTGVSYDDNIFLAEEIKMINLFFESFGKMIKVPENMLNTVTCASASSPAYVYMFIEALADSVVKYGMSRKDAYKFVAETVVGSAKMVLETGKHPGELKDMVCSPGGTTIEAVEALEEYGFRNSIMKATDACYNKMK